MFVYILGLAVFAQGTSEFMLSGLVPDIARDLAVPVGASASLTSAYAIGMVVGAPVMAVLSARWPRRTALVVFLVAFVVVHVVGAVTSNFAVLFGCRVVAAVANAGFLAVAMSVVGAQGAAVLVGGVTLSCVVGVPAGALLGQFFGWRSAFWAVAALSVPALAFVVRSAPATAVTAPVVDLAAEVRVLRSGALRRTLLLAALVNCATFATFAYLAVIATGVAELPAGAVPALLAAFGAGAFAGVTARVPDRWLTAGLVALPLGWLALVLVSARPVPLFALTAVQGALSFGVGSALITRVLRLAPEAPSLGGAFATVALNVGAVVGPAVAGAVTELTGDHRHAVWSSVVASLLATACALPRRRHVVRRR